MTVLAKMGGRQASQRFFRSSRVPTAPSRVARLPKITSQTTQPDRMLDSRQPMNSPGTAAGKKQGRMVSASEKRTWICPEDRPMAAASMVSST